MIRAWGRRRPPAWWEFLTIMVGCFLLALGFRLFTNPNGIVAGGVVGLSTVLQGAFGWDPAKVQAAVNLPLLLLGWILLGKEEGLRSTLGSICLPLSIALTKDIPPLTHDPLVGTIFGGAFFGVALGLILSAWGSVGGYSLLARVFSKHFGVSVASAMLAMDGLTIVASGWRFGAEKALLGLLAAYVTRVALDRTLVGFGRSFVALIISSQHETLRERLLHDLDRGMTVLNGEGGYTGEARPVLMVVLGQTEVSRLRSLVAAADPEAFVVISQTAEVLGRGFVGHRA